MKILFVSIAILGMMFAMLLVKQGKITKLERENQQLKTTFFGTNKWYFHSKSVITLTITNNNPSWVLEQP